jgi:DNA invertase Pin-like site-specific DNA recombinase
MRAVIWAAVSTKAQVGRQNGEEFEGKESLPTQEAQARELCASIGATVIAVLRVPGHSRRYYTIAECAKDMRDKGITAFDDLLELLDNRQMDVLVCRDGNRFARKQTLHAEVTERIIDAGARIYSLADGWVDKHNYRMWIAMNGYKAASEVDENVKKRAIGMMGRFKRGLNAGRLPCSHRLEYNSEGEVVRIALNPATARLWDDVATLLLEGVGWRLLGRELYERFGHAPPTAKSKYYGKTTLRYILLNPYFWGHAATGYDRKIGLWAFDPDEPLPDGVEIRRNNHEPVYKGELAELVKAELRRRHELVKGRARPYSPQPLSGLLVCGDCGCRLGRFNAPKQQPYWMCSTKNRPGALVACTERAYITERKAMEQVREIIQEWQIKGNVDVLEAMVVGKEHGTTLANLKAEMERIRTEIEVLIGKQAAAPANVGNLYDIQIVKRSERLEALKQEIQKLSSTAETPEQMERRRAAFVTIQQLGDDLWEQEPLFINQTLVNLLGSLRFVVYRRNIYGVTLVRRGR